MNEKRIKELLENSSFGNPVIIKNRYGFTKFWEEKGIKFLSWGKDWMDKEPSAIDPNDAISIIIKSRLGINT